MLIEKYKNTEELQNLSIGEGVLRKQENQNPKRK
jgi:hypothetical protein